LIRNALRPVARRDAAQVAAELRKIYTAPAAEAAFGAIAAFIRGVTPLPAKARPQPGIR
jgi:transposase-like protein